MLGSTLRALREARGVSQTALAALLGCHGAAVSRYESGSRSPDLATLSRILDALDATDAERLRVLAAAGQPSPVGLVDVA